MAITISAQTARCGKITYFHTVGPSGYDVPVTSHTSDPTMTAAGVGVTLYGPVWDSSAHTLGFIAYSHAVIAPGATVLFSASAGWCGTGSGSAPAATNQSVQNSSGSPEPGIGNVLGFDAQALAANQTMPVGVCVDIAPAINYHALTQMKNLALRMQNPMVAGTGSGATFLGDGTPVSWANGDYIHGVFFTATANPIDSTSFPNPLGIYQIQYDEGNAANPQIMWLWTSNTHVTGLDPQTGPVTLPGAATSRTTVNGVTTITYTVSYTGTPASYALGINLGIKSTSNPQAYSASNLWIIGPGETMQRNIDTRLTLSASYIRKVKAANGNIIWGSRHHNQVSNSFKNSCQEIADLRKVTDWTWANPPNQSIPPGGSIVAYRYWNCSPDKDNVVGDSTFPYAATPNLYSNRFGLSGSDSLNSYTTAYSGTAPNRVGDNGVMFNLGDQYVPIEFRCSTPHGLRTCDEVVFPASGAPTVTTMASNGSSNVTDGHVTTANISVCVFVTGPNTFVIVDALLSGNSISNAQHFVDITSSTAEVSCSFSITRKIPDADFIPYEAVFAWGAQLGSKVAWVNVWWGMSAACVAHIASLALPYIANGMKIVVETANENWNSGFRGYLYSKAFGQLLKYAPNNTAFSTNYYSTATGSFLSQDQMACLLTAMNHDIFASVLGESNIIRSFGVQYDGSSESSNYIAFGAASSQTGRTATAIPMGSFHVAPYILGVTDVTVQEAFSTTGTNPGSWTVDMCCSFFAMSVKYSCGQTWIDFSNNYTNIQGYSGPGGYNGQVGNKPGIYAYEASPQNCIPIASSMKQLSIDMQNYTDWYIVEQTCYFQYQVGNPSISGSGCQAAMRFALAGIAYGGTSQQQPWYIYQWCEQQPGDPSGATDTATSQFTLNSLSVTGASATTQQMITAQGIPTGDGISNARTNDIPAGQALLDWIGNANAQPLPPPPPPPPPPPSSTAGQWLPPQAVWVSPQGTWSNPQLVWLPPQKRVN